MRIYLDVCISPYLARALRELERHPDSAVEVLPHDEHFQPDALDTQWLAKLHTLEIDVLVTSDMRIRRSPDERRAWLEARVLTYFMSDTYCNNSSWPQVEELIRWWPILKRHAKAQRGEWGAFSLPWNEKKPRQLESGSPPTPASRSAKRPR